MPKGVYQHKKGYKRPPFSKEWREKISKTKIGKNYNWKGGKKTEKRRKCFSEARRRALKKGSNSFHTLEEWETLKAQYNWTCPCCGLKELFENQKCKTLTEDHIIPLNKGGSDNIENIQPLCRSCNCKKHTKIIKF